VVGPVAQGIPPGYEQKKHHAMFTKYQIKTASKEKSNKPFTP
jgi:hypothetical protein